jgi:hypothetical protein
MSVTPSPIGGFAAQFFDNNGVILSGGKIFTYAAGTTTPQASYTSALGITPHSNPIILDSAGRVPGGEIWLTDGLVYKFVIETATSILIGTYDNITGVNSNFVNYTIQEEIITATAGQTVFNLSTINYTPGTNSLTVYIDGVNQYVGDSYLETDSDTVTFTSGVHVGGEVKFTTAVQTTTGAVDANNVGYTANFTGAVGQTVQTKLEQTVSVKDFGAVGDGITDDTAAIQAAFDASDAVYFPESTGNYMVSMVTAQANGSYFGPGTIAKISGSAGAGVIDIPYGADNVTIDGLGIEYDTTTYGHGPITAGSTGGAINQTTNNISVTNCRLVGISWFTRTVGTKVVNNHIRNGGLQSLSWGDRITFSGNIITNDAAYTTFNGIGANNTDATPAQRGLVVIADNVIETYRMGIEWRDWTTTTTNVTNRSIMSNNTIRCKGSSSVSFGISLNADGWDICGNTIERDGTATVGYGIEAVDTVGNIISGNIVSGFATGIGVYGATSTKPAKKNVVSSNYVSKCLEGIQLFRFVEDTVIDGNSVFFTTHSSPANTHRAIRIDGDSAPANGTYGTRQAYRTILSNNSITCDTSGDAATNYNYIQIYAAVDTIVSGNTISISSGTVNSNATYIFSSDNTTICNNRYSFKTGTSCGGVNFFQDSGRRLSIHGNTFSGFTRAIERAGSSPFYNLNIYNNLESNCSLAPRVFPSNAATQMYGSRISYNTAAPILGTWNAGDVIFNSAAGAGWKCSVSGTAGTLPTTTADATNLSTTITLSTLINVEEGQYIAIAGVTGTKKIVSINRNNATAVINVAADATVAAAAVSFVAPTFVALPF